MDKKIPQEFFYMKMKNFLLALAQDKINGKYAPVKFFMYCVSLFYLAAIKLLICAYNCKLLKRHKLESVVISVGNITLGGTGKTPLVEFIARRVQAKGKNVVILSRGWPREEEQADEVKIYREKIPHIPVVVGRDRYQTGKKALRTHQAETLILDDGFQHVRLFRDLDIVTVDMIAPFGNRHVIPRGILREPISHLKRADVIVLTRTDIGRENVPRIKQIILSVNNNALIVETIHKPISIYDPLMKTHMPPSVIKGVGVGVVSGIGNPLSFEQTVSGLGAAVAEKFRFPDHHQYTENDILRVKTVCGNKKIDQIITTLKDWIKICDVYGAVDIKVWVLTIELEIIKNEEEFTKRLFSLYKR
ncbi:MAG: tetraacyldisaccharide 4'-kinase [Candidatus Omnitrophota bacterium]